MNTESYCVFISSYHDAYLFKKKANTKLKLYVIANLFMFMKIKMANIFIFVLLVLIR